MRPSVMYGNILLDMSQSAMLYTMSSCLHQGKWQLEPNSRCMRMRWNVQDIANGLTKPYHISMHACRTW